MAQIDLKAYKKSFYYNGKCNDYDDDGDLISSLFRDATEMAGIVDGDNPSVINLTYKEFKSILGQDYPVPQECLYQINIEKQIAWIYNESEDIHYFFQMN